jgi:PTH1 family peptidyl-tRNA hydrolase
VAQAIVGLGNPGPEYRDTRHNVGQRVVDGVARRIHARFAGAGAHQVAAACRGGETLYLVKPGVFMSATGPAVAQLCEVLRLSPSDLVLVFDDLDLPLGTVRVRMKGSAGGHNGLRSLIASLGTSEIRRVKVGIGRPAGPDGMPSPPGQREEIRDHVLSPFAADEMDAVDRACTLAGERLLGLVDSRGSSLA